MTKKLDEDENILSYNLLKGKHVINTIRKQLSTTLPKKVKNKAFYAGRRLSSLFQVNNNTKKEQENNIVDHINCPKESFEHSYIGESGRRLAERVKDRNSKYLIEKRHIKVELNKFKFIG